MHMYIYVCVYAGNGIFNWICNCAAPIGHNIEGLMVPNIGLCDIGCHRVPQNRLSTIL